MNRTDPITRAVAKRACTGCGACAALAPHAIVMVDDPTLGLRAKVAPTPAARTAAQAVAPACAGIATDRTELGAADALDRRWGPVLAVWEGFAADPQIRHRGSSGGAVTALSLSLLRNGAADLVSHVAADPADPTRNSAVLSSDRAALLRGAGSRYAPADACATLGAIATGDATVAFVGKPCDVASTKRAAAGNPTLERRLGPTISIFCAGTPTTAGTHALVDRLGKPRGATLIDLRYRGNGWPGPMRARWRDSRGRETDSEPINYAEGWGGILQATRPWRCRICTDHTGIFADISVGDPWHEPPTRGAQGGRSLIVARTQRGVAMVDAAIKSGFLVAMRRPRRVLDAAQPNLVDAHASAFGRRLAMRLVGLRVPADRGFPGLRLWLSRLTLRRKVQSVTGTLRRIAARGLWRPERIGDPS